MSTRRRVKVPSCAIVGVIASADELRLATTMRAPPDLFELRLDHLPHLRESQLLQLPRPFIITARHQAEGGSRLQSNRSDLLLKFLPRAAFVDIELRSLRELGDVWKEARRLRVGRICSVHDFKRTPGLAILNKQLERAHKSGANVFKLVTRADTAGDLSTLFEFLRHPCRRTRLCVMATGKLGPISRVLFGRGGSSFIYAPIRHPLHDGQLTLSQLRRWRDFYAKN